MIDPRVPTQWKQERPQWCPHIDCGFIFREMDAACCGKLPQPEPHDGDFNTHRFCLNGAADNGGVFDLQVNTSDLWWFRRLFDAIDGKRSAEIDKWGIDKSTGTPILIYDQCSVIQDEQAYLVMRALSAQLAQTLEDAARHRFAMRHVYYYSAQGEYIVDISRANKDSAASVDYEKEIDAARKGEEGKHA